MKYTVLDTPNPETDMHPIQIDEGEFEGWQVVFGRISFGGTDEDPTLKFDYEVVNDYNVSSDRTSALEQVVGDLIVQLLQESIDKKETIYTGGT
jgi:hypothetical protein